MINIIEDCH